MALDDIVFPDGDKQGLVGEMAAGTLSSPADMLYVATSVHEISTSTHLGAPVDMLFDKSACEELPHAGGEINYGWVT